MLLKKAIQDLITHSKLYEKGEVLEALPSCRQYYLIKDCEMNDLFINFWNTYQILHIQATYLSKRIKKAYKALVEEVLSTKDAPQNKRIS